MAGTARALRAAMIEESSLVVRLGFPVLALVVWAVAAMGVHRACGARTARRFALLGVGWFAFTAVLAASGVLANSEARPPRLLLLFVPMLVLTVRFGFSRWGSALASLPVPALVAFHSFRLPLELLMHRAAGEGVMPVQMSFSGWNFDIASGATAAVVAVLASRGLAPRWLLLSWNALGTALLLTILGIAIASLPALAWFGHEPARLNTFIAHFPFIWLPSGLVSAAAFGHVLLWRRLLSHDMRGRVESLVV